MRHLNDRLCAILASVGACSWLALCALGAPEAPPAANGGDIYEEARAVYKGSTLSQRIGPVVDVAVFNVDISSTPQDEQRLARLILGAGDEVISVAGIPIRTVQEYGKALAPYAEGANLPIQIKVVRVKDDTVRAERIESISTRREIEMLMNARFFRDERLIDLALIKALFPEPAEVVLQQQRALVEQVASGLTATCPDFAVVLKPTNITCWDEREPRTVRLDPGDVVSVFALECARPIGVPSGTGLADLVRIRDGERTSTRIYTHQAPFEENWAQKVRLGPRQLLIRAYALRAKGLVEAADRNLAFLSEAYPKSKEALALSAAADKRQLASEMGYARELAKVGNSKGALKAANDLMAKNPAGPEAQAAAALVQEIKADAQTRLTRAAKALDAGDTSLARRELSVVLDVLPDDPTARQTQTRCECMELVAFGENAATAGNWAQAREAFRDAAKKGPDATMAQRLRAGLDRLSAEASRRIEEVKKLRAEGRVVEAKRKIADTSALFPDDPKVAQYARDMTKEINDQFITSGLKAKWDKAVDRLNEQDRLNGLAKEGQAPPAFTIHGRITDQALDGKTLVLLGTAIPGNQDYSAVGAITKDSCIVVKDPERRLVQGSGYMGGVHYLAGKTTVKNAFGASVKAFVYGPPPPEPTALVEARDEVHKLRAKIEAMGVDLPGK
jgi:tetratricopeptide (TPR) repeat protein